MGNKETKHTNLQTTLKDGDVVELRSKRTAVVSKFLGQGGFSSIYLVETEDGKRCALKRILLATAEQETEALREARAHILLGGATPISPYIAALLESSMTAFADSSSSEHQPHVLHLLFPFYPEGDLTSRLLDDTAPRLDEAACLRLFAHITSALVAAHNVGVAHCDIKPQNVLLKTVTFPILIDWGSASFEPLTFIVTTSGDALALTERCSRFCSAAFRAPELWDVVKGKQVDLRKADSFALGCVLFAMLFEPRGFSPFESPTQGLLTLAVRSASVRFPSDSARLVSDGTVQLIRRLLSVEAKDRPTASECLLETQRLLDEEVDFAADFGNGKQ